MEIKDVYLYLRRLKDLDNQIKSLEYELDGLRLRMLPSGISYDGVRVQTSHEPGMERSLVVLHEKESEIARLRQNRISAQAEMIANINRIPHENEKAVVMGYYVAGKRVQDMAVEMGYSEDNIWMLKRKGVRHLAEIL